MSSGSLFLHPSDAEAACPRDDLVEVLAQAGLIGAAHAGRQNDFLVGDRFLQLITFMGCSPHIELDPPDGSDDDFCHVLIHVYAAPRLLVGTNTRPPRCPACRKRIDIEVTSLRRDRSVKPVACNHCGAHHPVAALQWRRDAGFSRLFVEIRSVFPGEAVPVESLFQALAATTGCQWDYFYLTDASGGQFQPRG